MHREPREPDALLRSPTTANCRRNSYVARLNTTSVNARITQSPKVQLRDRLGVVSPARFRFFSSLDRLNQ